MKFSHFFIDRPIFAGVLSIVVTLAGLIAMQRLPISEYPEVAPPSVVVAAAYPGASPAVVAETVAAPLEQAINGVENMLYMSSRFVLVRLDAADGDVQDRHRSRRGSGAGAEPRCRRR